MKLGNLLAKGLACVVLSSALSLLSAAWAAPPVRIAIVAGNGSGQEQSAVDSITANLQNNPNVVVSTVNPDWYLVCNFVESVDTAGGSAKFNGTATIKTTDGQIVATSSVQTNASDFSLQPGAPVNKRLVDNKAREALMGLVSRANAELEKALPIELDTRDRIIAAQMAASQDNYDQAINGLRMVGPDSTHFKNVQGLIAIFQMEKEAFEAVNEAQTLIKKGQYSQAIKVLGNVDPKSKRFKVAKEKIAFCKNAIAKLAQSKKRLAKNKPQATAGNLAKDSNQAQLQALEAQKQALKAQQKALDAQEALLKSKSAK